MNNFLLIFNNLFVIYLRILSLVQSIKLRIIEWKCIDKLENICKWPWSILRFYPCICLEGLRKSRGPNRALPEVLLGAASPGSGSRQWTPGTSQVVRRSVKEKGRDRFLIKQDIAGSKWIGSRVHGMEVSLPVHVQLASYLRPPSARFVPVSFFKRVSTLNSEEYGHFSVHLHRYHWIVSKPEIQPTPSRLLYVR